MRRIQDDYYRDVGIENGQLRFGPKRRRLSRNEWHAKRRQARLLTELFNEKNETIDKLRNSLSRAKTILKRILSKSLLKTSSNEGSKLCL